MAKMKTRTAKTQQIPTFCPHYKILNSKILDLTIPMMQLCNSSQKSCLVQAYIFQMSWPLLIKQDIYLKFQG